MTERRPHWDDELMQDALVKAIGEAAEYREAIDRVRDLHWHAEQSDECGHSGREWKCDTIRVIDEVLGEEEPLIPIVRVWVHHDPECWWAESPQMPGYTATADNWLELTQMVQEGVAFYFDRPEGGISVLYRTVIEKVDDDAS